MNWQAVAFDWNHARAFLVTAEEGTLSAAARALGLSQPTLGRQVAALEESLGVLLFERVGKSLSLTQTGRDLLAHVRLMGQGATGISLAASGHSDAIEGKVSVTAFDGAATYLLPRVLERLQTSAPGLQVDLLASNLVQDIQRREADIALRHVRPEQPDLIAKRLPDFAASLYASTAWLNRHGRPRTGQDLKNAPLIGYTSPGNMFADLQARGVPVTERNVRFATDSTVVAWEMIKQGLGIGVNMREVAAVTPGVEAVLPDFPPIPVPIWIVTHRELHTSRRIRLVFDLLAEAFSTLAR
jgi:DNA-binding transcriptional LysR family regulator